MANELYQMMGDAFGYDNAYLIYNGLSAIPFVGSMFTWYDDWAYTNDYLSNRSIGWSDVQYPTKQGLSRATSGAIRSGYNFVSSNLKDLYGS